MKKLISIVLVLIVIVCLAACGGGSTGGGGDTGGGGGTTSSGGGGGSGAAPSGDVVTLKLAHGHAPQSVLGIQYQIFADTVEELSGGTLTIEMYPGGTLLTDPETLDGVMEGVVDLAHVMSSFATGTVKDMSPVEMYGYCNGDDWQGFLEKSRPVINKIYEPFGLKFLASPYIGPNAFICNEKQIVTPDDMKGLTWRSAGTWYGKCIEAFGGAATSIPLADMTTAFERGTVNGTVVGWNVIYPLKLYESAPYLSGTESLGYFTHMLMNLDSWNKLSPEHQAVILEASKEFESGKGEEVGRKMIAEYIQGIGDEGGSIVYLTKEQQVAFVDAVEPVYDQMNDLSDNGNELIRIIKEGLAEWRAS